MDKIAENVFEITMIFGRLQDDGEVKTIEEIDEDLKSTISAWDDIKGNIYKWALEFEQTGMDYSYISEFATEKIVATYAYKYTNKQRWEINNWLKEIGQSDLVWCDLEEHDDGQLLEATKCFDSLYDYDAWQHLQIATGMTIPIEMARKINGMLYENNIEVLELHSSTLKDCYEKIILENDAKLKAKEELKIYSKPIMEAIRQRMDLEKDDTSRDAEIMEMDKDDILRDFLEWEGVRGYYACEIKAAVSEIYNVDLDY